MAILCYWRIAIYLLFLLLSQQPVFHAWLVHTCSSLASLSSVDSVASLAWLVFIQLTQHSAYPVVRQSLTDDGLSLVLASAGVFVLSRLQLIQPMLQSVNLQLNSF